MQSQYVPSHVIRAAFARAMSDMYQHEVPLYGTLVAMVQKINQQELDHNPTLKHELDASGGLQRLSAERHGAIRLGKAEELATMRRLFAVIGMQPVGYYDLIVLREDPEQPIRPTTGGMWTGPVESRAITLDPAYAAINFRHWVRIHLYAKSIITNRLHSSIIGAVAGKPVTLGPGSYHKNRSVWEYSLANQGVHWTDSIEPSPNKFWSRLPKRIQNSYKVRRLRLAVNRVPLS